MLVPGVTPRAATLVDPLERPLRPLPIEGGKLRLSLGPWELATILLG